MTPTNLKDLPFKGLMPYEEADALFFFGRGADVGVITSNLMASRLTILYGPSGVGKSSVLYAGVANFVRGLTAENMAGIGKPEFGIVVHRSWREDPVGGLLIEVQAAVEQVTGRRFEPTPAGTSLADALAEWAGRLDGTLLVILDQFEEYFLYHPREDGPGTFAGEFAGAVNRGGLRVNFLVSLRDDALSKLDRFDGKIRGLLDNYLRLAHLDRDAATEAILGPVSRYNALDRDRDDVQVEPELIAEVLDQVKAGAVELAAMGRGFVAGESGDEGENLPIETSYLQLVMKRLWEAEQEAGSHVLRKVTFAETLGGAKAIVRDHFDRVMEGLTQVEREAASNILPYLVTPSGSKIAQQPAFIAARTKIPAERVEAVLLRLTEKEGRILRKIETPSHADSFEIFHDVLARVVLDYVTVQEARRARTAAWRESERAKRQAWRQFWVSILLALGLGLALLMAAVINKLASDNYTAWKEASLAEDGARRAVRRADSLRLAAQAVARARDGFDLALLLSLEACRVEETLEARASVYSVVNANPRLKGFLRGPQGRLSRLAYSPDGLTVAVGNSDGTISLWDVAARRTVCPPIPGHKGPVKCVAYSPDGALLASAGDDTTILLLDVKTRRPAGEPLKGHDAAVRSVAFSPDGATLASGDNGGDIRLWDVRSRVPAGAPLKGHTARVYGLAFSPDGATLASCGRDTAIILWDVKERRPRGAPLKGHTEAVNCVKFSPDGSLLASASTDMTVILWDVKARAPQGDPLTGHEGEALGVAFSPDGKTLASCSLDRTIVFWDVSTHKQRGEALTGSTDVVLDLAFSPDGKSLTSAAFDGTLALWDVAWSRPLGVPLARHKERVTSVTFSPDGRTLASGSEDGTVVLRDTRTRAMIGEPLRAQGSPVNGVAISPDGGTLASASTDQSVYLWDAKTRMRKGGPLTGPKGASFCVAFSPDGRNLASGWADGGVYLWDLKAPGSPGARLAGHRASVFALAYSPDGATLASGSEDSTVILWDVKARTPVGPPLKSHREAVWALAFSPDGATLASGGIGAEVVLWDVARRVASGEPLTNHKGIVSGLAFTPDGRTLAGSSVDTKVILWDVGAREPYCTLDVHVAAVNAVAVSPDGSFLATGHDDGVVVLWDIRLPSWKAHACRVAGRNLTRAEWSKYLGPDVPYRATCDDFAVDGGATPGASAKGAARP